jgi:hypothetical protein
MSEDDPDVASAVIEPMSALMLRLHYLQIHENYQRVL